MTSNIDKYKKVNKTVQIWVRVTEEEKEQMKLLAEDHEITLSAFVRFLFFEGLTSYYININNKKP